MKTWVDELVSKWKSKGVKINGPASNEDITVVESSLDFNFPEDFKEFYLQMNGFRGLDWQEYLFTFWPLEMIVSEYDQKENGFIGFADYSLKVNAIGFKRGEGGIFKIYPSLANEPAEYIASSFKEVVHIINSNDGLIY